MSGNSGPDYAFGAGSANNCSGLTRRLALQAIDPDVIDDLQIGVVLTLILHDDGAPTIAAITERGREAGAIMPDQGLIDCMRLAVQFVADVLTVDGAHVLLAVRVA